jgi:flagellar basal body P-ring formation protein FlgA
VKRAIFLTAAVICIVLFAAISLAGDTGLCQIQAAVRDYIEANMPWPQGTVRIDFLSGEPETIPQGRNLTLRIEPAGNAEFIGDAAFLVRVLSGGKLLRTETVRIRIEVLRDIVVAARAIRSGIILTEQDVRLVKKWVRRIPPDSLSSLDETLGKRITTQARPGMEISVNMLREVPLVQKGKIVKVVFENGVMRITTVGMSEEDGTAGSIVRVRNVTSNKIIYARVLGDSLVGIEL